MVLSRDYTYSCGRLSAASVCPVYFRGELASECGEEHPLDVLAPRWRVYGCVFLGNDERVLVARSGALGREIPFGVDPRARNGVRDVVVLAWMDVRSAELYDLRVRWIGCLPRMADVENPCRVLMTSSMGVEGGAASQAANTSPGRIGKRGEFVRQERSKSSATAPILLDKRRVS